MLPARSCRWCTAKVGPIISRATLKTSTVVACAHCDTPHPEAGCVRCARMKRTVIIVDRPSG